MPVINMLTGVKTNEVSLVRRGANNKRFALSKSKELTMNFELLLKSVLSTEAEGEKELVETLKSAGADEEAISVAVANFRLQAGFKDKLSKEQFAEVTKAAGNDAKASDDKMTDEEKKAADAEEDKKKKGNKNPFAKSTPVAGMPVEMQKAFDEQKSEIQTLRKEAEENSAKVEAMKKSAELKDYVAKCKDEYSHVPGQSVEEMGLMLQKAYEVSEDFGKQLEGQWSKTHSAIKKSALLGAQGAMSSTHGGSSAWGKMESIAKEYVQKDSKITKDAAMGQVMENHPELYQQYLDENAAQTGRR